MKTKGYSPNCCDTYKRFVMESSTHPSFAPSDFHRPCLLKRRSWTPALAAAVAPPALRLCRPYLSGGCPSSINFFLNSSLSVLYIIRPADLSFSPSLDLVIALKRNRSLCWSMLATLMYFSNIATGHVLLEVDFISLPQLVCLASLNLHCHHLLCDGDVAGPKLDQLIKPQKSGECQETGCSQPNI